MVDDTCAAWRAVPHEQAVLGHWRCGLANALDGSEDSWITREAATFWFDAEHPMPELRQAAIEEVDRLIDNGLTWDRVRELIHAPQDPGRVEEEGAELEGPRDPSDPLWDDDWENGMIEDDKQAHQDDAQWAMALSAPSVQAVFDAPVLGAAGDDANEVVEADAARERMKSLQRCRRLAIGAGMMKMSFWVDKELRLIQKGISAKDKATHRSNAHLRLFVGRFARERAAVLAEAREKDRERRQNEAKERLLRAEAKAVEDKRKRKDAALKEKLDALPKHFTSATTGQGQTLGGKGKYLQARIDCLDRLRLRSPPLPDLWSVRWPDLRRDYAIYIGRKFGNSTGLQFITRINDVIKSLGSHFTNAAPGEKGGDKDAFFQFVLTMWKETPRAATSVEI